MTVLAQPGYETLSAWHQPSRARQFQTLTATTVTELTTPELTSAFRELWALKSLQENWNSYGSASIAQSALQSAHRLLGIAGELRSLPDAIVPTARGGVQFEWKTADRELEIEVTPSRDAVVCLSFDEEPAEELSLSAEQITVERLFRLVHG